MSNRLAKEKSPYLLQHAHNPVDWYPWGEEAFERARREGRPIFLSIGYSTCHWCHVMERESFEDPAVARLLNEAFVCVKVDREERPDVDSLYMAVCQMLTGHGGWPLTLLLTPEKKPFFAGTYFPREGRFGRPGMLDLVPRLRTVWEEQRDQVLASAEELTRALQDAAESPAEEEPGAGLLEAAYSQLSRTFDETHGGFGRAPKFPSPHQLLFLLRRPEPRARAMVEKSLTAMRLGGIYDHLGFGFHRYSTDREWLVPHFEKMLYDQALLALAYLETFQATRRGEFARTAREIFEYVRRDMTAPEGAFYSAEDADSEGAEGKFYVWTEAEFRQVLGKDADAAIEAFGVKAEGNFREESTAAATRQNILHLRVPADVDSFRERLLEARRKRVRPLRDDKVLLDWNGLMIAALARGSQVLEDPEFARRAARAAEFALSLRVEGALPHRWRGESAVAGMIDDHAFLAFGLTELYEATFEQRWLEAAAALMREAERRFAAPNGAYLVNAIDQELPVRPMDFHDGAIPSGNSVAFGNLLRLALLTGDAAWERRAAQLGRAMGGLARRGPTAFTMFLTWLDFALGEAREAVLAPGRGLDTMLSAIRREFLPRTVVRLDAGKPALDGRAAAYVCRHGACELPTADAKRMLALLRDRDPDRGAPGK